MRHAAGRTLSAGRLRGFVTSGMTQLSGFALSVLALGVVSLITVPAIIAAGGPAVWGAVALGQALGLVSTVFVIYGWNRSGPTNVARASPSERRREYIDSIVVKGSLLAPAALFAALLSYLLAPEGGLYAAMAATVATLNGLSGIWYFVGLARSYSYFLVETLPRVLATIIGIGLLKMGFGVYVGLACIGAGLLFSFAAVTVWVYLSTSRAGAKPIAGRRLLQILGAQKNGAISTVLSASYIAVPLGIVSLVAPAAQPAFALADKLFRQLLVAIGPIVAVIQGWIPRATQSDALDIRIRVALVSSCFFSIALGIGASLVGTPLLRWMGDGQITFSQTTVVLVGVLFALSFFDGVLGNAVLATLERLDVAVRATCISAIVGLPLVAAGAVYYGTPGAFGGLIAGLALRIIVELWYCLRRSYRTCNRDDSQDAAPSHGS